MSVDNRSRPHWRGLDGLRALAVIAVVIYHFSPATLPGGFLGVDVFFVISGYLITRMLTEEFLTAGRISTRTFYLRRARRLLPALGLVLAAVSAAALIWRDQLATVRGGVLSTAVFGANWWLAIDHQSYFVSTGRPSMLQHLWSLGVEEQFYLVWPVVAAATLASGRRSAVRRGRPPQSIVARLVVLAVGLSVLSTALTWLIANHDNVPYGNDGSTLYYGTDTHCMGLLLGAAFGAWSARVRLSGSNAKLPSRPLAVWKSRAGELCGAAALVALGVIMVRLADYSHSLYRGDFLWVSALVVVVIAAAGVPGSRLGLLLEGPLLRWVGVRSYSIYLWHWPITIVTRPGLDTSLPVWIDQLLRIALTLALADASYRFLEAPVRRLGFRGAMLVASSHLRAQWRRVPPTLSVSTSVGLVALSCLGAAVIIVGPAAPMSSAASSVGAGGRNLRLTRPDPSATSGSSAVDGGVTPLPKVSGFGDSVILGARHALAATFPGGTLDALEGRQPDPILTDVRKRARAGKLNPLVVLHVGNNGLIDPVDLRETLQSLSSVQLVLVLTDHLDPYDHNWQKPNNATINKIVPTFTNARVVDWDAIAAQHHHWLYPDDLHLRQAGAIGYADLLVDAYRAYAAQTPAGPPSAE
jgi:peptidoglycan/LPS O-acetylase OafA/YrhL